MRSFIIANRNNKPPKKKKCKVCQTLFEVNSFQPLRGWCSPDCGYKYSQKLIANKEAKEKRDIEKNRKVEKQSLLTHKDWIKLFQITFNQFIRLRDKNKPCVSCRNPYADQYDAGHFIATTKQFLRFHPDNVHGQCRKCNRYMVGNIIPYRIELINRIGIDRVEWLEANAHRNLELTIPEIQELIKDYKLKIKALK